jgi:hypothetical protein
MRQRALRDQTVDWMTADVADRCRAVILLLESPMNSATEMDAAAGTLRSAADDLVSVVELLGGQGAAVRAPIESDELESFDLSFESALSSNLD